jgi:hypothetical protein
VTSRLRKRDVEQLTDRYDDDPVAALSTALAIIIGPSTATASARAAPHSTDVGTDTPSRWLEYVRRCPVDLQPGLAAQHIEACDELLRLLIEGRGDLIA